MTSSLQELTVFGKAYDWGPSDGLLQVSGIDLDKVNLLVASNEIILAKRLEPVGLDPLIKYLNQFASLLKFDLVLSGPDFVGIRQAQLNGISCFWINQEHMNNFLVLIKDCLPTELNAKKNDFRARWSV